MTTLEERDEPPYKLLCMKKLVEYTGLNSTALKAITDVKSKRYDPTFPHSVLLTHTMRRWVESEVKEWLDNRKKLVEDLAAIASGYKQPTKVFTPPLRKLARAMANIADEVAEETWMPDTSAALAQANSQPPHPAIDIAEYITLPAEWESDDTHYFRHVKSQGLYAYVCSSRDEASGEQYVVYRNAKTGEIWHRPASDFYDGRFVKEN